MFFSIIFADNNCYIPLHLNLIRFSGSAFEKDYLDTTFCEKLFEYLIALETSIFVLDFDGINMVESRSMQGLKGLFEVGKNVIIINASEVVTNIILNAECKDLIVQSTGRCLLANPSFIKQIGDEHDFIRELKDLKTKTICSAILKNTKDGLYPLESSNVYSNMYIDIKKVFSEPSVLHLVVNELCKLFSSNFDRRNIYGLICTSYNGASLATILGNLLEKPVCYLMNLGPHLSIKDRNMINGLLPNKNYIYIYDFICLGTEYKLAKTVALLKNSQVVGALGVSRHPDILRHEDNNHSIFIADSNNGFNYNIFTKLPE